MSEESETSADKQRVAEIILLATDACDLFNRIAAALREAREKGALEMRERAVDSCEAVGDEDNRRTRGH